MKTQRLMKTTFFSLIIAALALPGRLGAEVDLWPAFERTADSTTVLYPFFVHEGDFMMVFPWYYRTNGGKDHHVLWPIAKTSEGRVARLAPFWFSGQDGAFTLFPLIRQTSDYTVWTVPPVYHRHDGSFQAVFPFYMRSPEKLFVFPAFYRSQSPSVTRTLLFPVYAAERGPRGETLWLAPYYQHRSPDRSATAIYSLFYYETEKRPVGSESDLWLLGPLFRRTVWKSDEGIRRSKTWLLPLFGHSVDRTASGSRETERSTWALWPLYRRWSVSDDEGRIVERKRRFVIFSDELARSGERTFKLLGLPIIERMPAEGSATNGAG